MKSGKNYSDYTGSTHKPAGGSNYVGMIPRGSGTKVSGTNHSGNRRPNSPSARGVVPLGVKKGRFPLG